MAIQRFEDIVAWQKVQDLAVEVYREFSNLKDYYYKDQIQRASVSMSNNIAEGFGRGSDADFSRFLVIAKGSANEARSMLYLGEKLCYINHSRMAQLADCISEIRKMLTGLIKSLQK